MMKEMTALPTPALAGSLPARVEAVERRALEPAGPEAAEEPEQDPPPEGLEQERQARRQAAGTKLVLAENRRAPVALMRELAVSAAPVLRASPLVVPVVPVVPVAREEPKAPVVLRPVEPAEPMPALPVAAETAAQADWAAPGVVSCTLRSEQLTTRLDDVSSSLKPELAR